MEAITRNPATGIYPATPDYVHAMEVQGAGRLLFVSGTMGLADDGSAPSDLATQLELIWGNIGRILAEAGMTAANIVRVTSYLRDVAYVPANSQARLRALGAHRVPTTAIVVETLSPDWLVEVEVVAAA
ncbi:RidA family protein [Devosia sediminis]|uniref:RidA family protein n=1 Tax=Devosia sediminis TaxID=2798801 RepID=A0A934IW52_9HYPH|nr:RidA family protein [Devosia sediminis]MBJ3783898.1 RidA family protein [Devosia sediminis]